MKRTNAPRGSTYLSRKSELKQRQQAARYARRANRLYPSPYKNLGVPISRNGIMTICQKREAATNPVVTSTSLADGLYSWKFTLQDLNDYTSYQAIYDQYRINWIKAFIYPVSQDKTPSNQLDWAPMVSVIDYDDANTPTSYYQLLQYGSSMVHTTAPTQKIVVRKFRPCVQAGNYNSSAPGLSSSGVNSSPWLDIAVPTIDHYGFKIAVKQSTSTNVSSYYVMFQYCISFNQTR